MGKIKNERRIAISISGAYGENNVGDDILQIALIRGIRRRFSNCSIIVFTADRNNTEKLLLREREPLDSIRTIYSGRRGLFEPSMTFPGSLCWIPLTFRYICRSHLLLIGPGNPVKDDTNRFKLLFHLSRAVIAYFANTPFAFIGIGVGRLRGAVSRYLFRIFGNKAAFMSTRDETSSGALRDLGIRRPVVVSLTDLSFCETDPAGCPEE